MATTIHVDETFTVDVFEESEDDFSLNLDSEHEREFDEIQKDVAFVLETYLAEPELDDGYLCKTKLKLEDHDYTGCPNAIKAEVDHYTGCTNAIKAEVDQHELDEGRQSPFATIETKPLSDLVTLANYGCNQCEFKTKNLETLEWHYKQQHRPKTRYVFSFTHANCHKCLRCGHLSDTLATLETHYMKKHVPIWRLCHQSSYSIWKTAFLKRDEMIEKRKQKTNRLRWKPFKCSFCPYSTKNQQELASHMLNNELIRCLLCTYESQCGAQPFREHMIKDHQEDLPILTMEKTSKKTERKISVRKKAAKSDKSAMCYKCRTCDQTLGSRKSLTDHILNSLFLSCPHCKFATSCGPHHLRRHMIVHQNKKLRGVKN